MKPEMLNGSEIRIATEKTTNALEILKKVTEISLILLATVMIILVFWGIDKGINLVDESFYLQGYQAGQEKIVTLIAFTLLVISRLFGWLTNVIQFRILSIVLTVISSIIFTLGFYRFMKYVYPNKRIVLRLFTLLVWFVGVGFCWCIAIPLTFSYNIFVQVVLMTIAGLFLYLLSFENTNQMIFRLWLIEATIGFLTAMVLLVKPPSAILIVATNVCFIAILLYRDRSITFKNSPFIPFLIGILSGLVVVLFGLHTFSDFKYSFTSNQNIASHDIRDVVIRSIKDIYLIFQQIFSISWLYIVTFFLIVFQKSHILNNRKLKLVNIFVIGWIIIFFVINNFKDVYLNSIYGSLPLGGFIFTGIFLSVLLIARPVLNTDESVKKIYKNKFPNIRKILAVVLLVILPFVGSLGTNNHLQFQIWIHIAPWCGVIVILLQELENDRKFQFIGWGIFIIFAFWLSGRWVDNYLYKPYGLSNPS